MVTHSTPSSTTRPPLFHSEIKLAIQPHMHTISILDVSVKYRVAQLALSICRMLNLGDNGTLMQQWDYHSDMLPPTFHFLDVWTNFHLAVSGYNDFYETEYISIHCKPEGEGRGAQFSPVFVEVNPLASSIHHE